MKIKAGLEVHIQLDTEEKLFCKCKTTMKEEVPKKIVVRKLHPVAGELGLIDVAAQYEYLREREYYYEYFENESCLIELDEEPPREINKEALELALKIAMLLNCKIPDKIQVMRKTVIDGSNTSGFQRTALIGFDGYIIVNDKKIGIKSVCLEEDACAIDKEENGKVYYKLNRLGIPLVEITTSVFEVENAKEIEEVAFNIGWLARTIKKVKRGIGTIRQDVNISIDSERIELKGIQKLEDISKVVNYEIKRLIDLKNLSSELKKRNAKISEIFDFTEYFKNSSSNLIQKFLNAGNKIFGLVFYNFKGLMNYKIAERTFGKEIADYLRTFNSGIIHSEENLEKYKLKEDFENICKMLKISENDVLAIFAAKNDKAVKFIKEKLEKLIEGKLEHETRKANQDLSTSFLRPLPGSARMYPETDLPLIDITKECLEKIRVKEEPLNVKIYRISKEFSIDINLVKEIARKDLLEVFENFLNEYKEVGSNFIANMLINLENYKIDFWNKQNEIKEILEMIKNKKLSKSAANLILSELKDKKLEEIIKTKDLIAFDKEELKNILKDLLNKNMSIDEIKKYLFTNEKTKYKVIPEILEEILKYELHK
ncbi:MAG: Glu-tRNA(Gln) amidotransferase subunit GatE [Candidatus Aenigmatarchaeota archaeon]